jgi:inhibitor of KinA
LVASLAHLGDQAVLAHLPDESSAWHFARSVRQAAPSWLVDVVSAYSSVAVFFDQDNTRLAEAELWLRDHLLSIEATAPAEEAGRLHRIPCCYEFQLDLERVARHQGIPKDEVIRRHAETEYRVFAIGFCPGFPFLGYLPVAISGVPRLAAPRVRLEAGSVGLTGRQTGIYTLPCPGGWNIIGRTPLELVNVEESYFPIRAGERVKFDRIDDREFHRLAGARLQG